MCWLDSRNDWLDMKEAPQESTLVSCKHPTSYHSAIIFFLLTRMPLWQSDNVSWKWPISSWVWVKMINPPNPNGPKMGLYRPNVTSLDLWIHLDFNFDPFPIWGFSSQVSVRSVGRAIRCLGNVVTWRPDVKTLKTLNSGDFRTFLPCFYRFYQTQNLMDAFRWCGAGCWPLAIHIYPKKLNHKDDSHECREINGNMMVEKHSTQAFASLGAPWTQHGRWKSAWSAGCDDWGSYCSVQRRANRPTFSKTWDTLW